MSSAGRLLRLRLSFGIALLLLLLLGARMTLYVTALPLLLIRWDLKSNRKPRRIILRPPACPHLLQKWPDGSA